MWETNEKGEKNFMNQILTYKTEKSKKIKLEKNLRFFVVVIIVFGIIFLAEGITGLIKGKNANIKIGETPQINITKAEGNTILNIKSNIGIQKLIYSWNDGIEETLEENGKTNFEAEIPTTIGTNKLNLKIIDSNSNTIIYEPITINYENDNPTAEELEQAISNDKTKPTISIESKKGKIVITAKDDVKMSYVTYKWNDGEEQKVTGLSSDEKTLTAEIDSKNVKEGTNKLTVNAYDKAGNVETIEKDVQGAKGSEIVVNQENDNIVINVKNDINITKIEYNFNGEDKTIDNINQKEYQFTLQLKDGENTIKISAYNDTLKSDYENKFVKGQTTENNATPTSTPTPNNSDNNSKSSEPKIKVGKNKNTEEIIVNVTDDSNITKIVYKFNGLEKTIDNINQKEYQFNLNLKDGENIIIINAYNANGKMSKYGGKTTK